MTDEELAASAGRKQVSIWYDEARASTDKRVPMSQRHMVACLAVKQVIKERGDCIDQLRALSALMKP